MELPGLRWNAAIGRRKSRRKFDGVELEPDELVRLKMVCASFRPFPQARAELVTEPSDKLLRGMIGSYGKITGAPVLIAFIGDVHDQYVNEKVGYIGEGIILEATAIGLDTCWVGGFFRPNAVASVIGIHGGERVYAVTPAGHALKDVTVQEKLMTGFGRTHRRKPLSELVSGLGQGEWSLWMRLSLEAARLAPSAVNRQPWRFHLETHSITVSVSSPGFTFNISKRLDCGIAMLHIEVAALACGVKGTWEFLQPPKVARFSVPGGSW